MLFSTLIPTFLHFCVAGISFLLVKTRPKKRAYWREEIKKVMFGEEEALSPSVQGGITYYWFFNRHLYPILIATAVFGLATWIIIELHWLDWILNVVQYARSLV